MIHLLTSKQIPGMLNIKRATLLYAAHLAIANAHMWRKPYELSSVKSVLPVLEDQRNFIDTDWRGNMLLSPGDVSIDDEIKSDMAAKELEMLRHYILAAKRNTDEVIKDGTLSYAQFVAASLLHPRISNKADAPHPPVLMYSMYATLVAPKMDIYEQAMFLANVVWETLGLTHVKEIACRHGGCVYGQYYGRGMIQLTWEKNYRDASYGIYGDDRLVRNPDLAATPSGAWRTALFYWMHRVRPLLNHHNAIKSGKFGYSVYAINGDLECGHNIANGAAYYRMQIYRRIMQMLGLTTDKEYGSLEGCGGVVSAPMNVKSFGLPSTPTPAAHTPVPAGNAVTNTNPRSAQKRNEPHGHLSNLYVNTKRNLLLKR